MQYGKPTDVNKQKTGKITAEQEPTNQCNFHVLMTNHIMTKLTNPNHDQRHKYQHLHLILKRTTAQVVETSVTNNSLSKDYLHLDDHTTQITVRNVNVSSYQICGRSLTCGHHTCERSCHEGKCGDCPRSGERQCPCGKTGT